MKTSFRHSALQSLAGCFLALLAACGGGSNTAADADALQAAAATQVEPAVTVPATANAETAALNPPTDSTPILADQQGPDATAAPTARALKAGPGALETSVLPTGPLLAAAVATDGADAASNFDAAFTYLPPSWSINWWGTTKPGNEVVRETRTGYTYSGAGALRFRINTLPSGSGVHLVYTYGFIIGNSYRSSVKLRSDVGSAPVVEVQLRRDVKPYNVFAVKRVTLSSNWQQVDLDGPYSWVDAGSLRIVPVTVGANVYVDDMSITNLGSSNNVAVGGINLRAVGGSSTTLETLKTYSMEDAFTTFAPGWYFNAYGGSSQGTFLAARESRIDYVHAGTGSQKYQVIDKKGGSLDLISSYAFVKGKTYRSTLYLRADTSTPVQVYMRRDAHPWDAFASVNVTLTTAWQKVQIEGTYLGDVSGSLRIALKSPTGTIWVDSATLSEVKHNDLAPFSTATVPDSLFGMHVNQLGVHNMWPGMETRAVRLWNTGTTWRDLQPNGPTWNFTSGAGMRLDMYVDYVARNAPGASIIYTLGQTPLWASSTPTVDGLYGMGASGAPKNMTDWRNYVRTLALRYKGKIRNWELWNEPDYAPHWNGSYSQLTEMARIAREELLAADSSNKLIGPGFSQGGGMRGLDLFLSVGGGAYIDIIGFHWYYSTNPESIGPMIDNVRGLMKTYGISGKPIWNTEGAFICDSAVVDCSVVKPTLAESRSVNARAMFIMAIKGIANFNFHVWEASNAYSKLVEADFVTQTEAAKAFTEARAWLKGAAVIDAYRDTGGAVHVVRIKRGAETFVALWSIGSTTLVNLPPEWAVTRARTLSASESLIPITRQLTIGQEPILLKP